MIGNGGFPPLYEIWNVCMSAGALGLRFLALALQGQSRHRRSLCAGGASTVLRRRRPETQSAPGLWEPGTL